jgi:gas vesicle protein
MSNSNGSSAGSVLLAFAVGALAGAAVALLYSPGRGEDLRRKIADKAREGRDTLASAVERGREAYEQARREQA